jgi:aspartate carbamoyltransferase catalytic subunit
VKNKAENKTENLSKNYLINSSDLTLGDLNLIFAKAKEFKENWSPRIKYDDLKDLPITLAFFEPSTRTKLSFELAASRLGADTLNYDFNTSSQSKGESLVDTMKTLESMGIRMFIVRHSSEGVPDLLQENSGSSIINAGDGTRDHPTQGLLDAFVLQQKIGDLKGKKITIVGDLLNSRVARSNLIILDKLGMDISICAPQELMLFQDKKWRYKQYENIDEALLQSDVLMLLRIQKERMASGLMPSVSDYRKDFGMTCERFEKKKDIVIMHPGPVNYGLELDPELYERENCLISDQVRAGVFIRMAVLSLLGQNIR